jgi:alkylhydroperoxidase/carboxymuconolactone decarboxylase family protein YurZ
MGVTSQVIVDVFWAASSFIGRAHVLSAVRAIHLANDVSNHEGTMPPSGPPAELKEFPELRLGNEREGRPALESTPEWGLIAQIEPQLARLCREFYGRVMIDDQTWTLPVGARELIAVVCLSYRGLPDLAADHIRAAIACGASAQHVLEALSAAIPMTGLVTLQIGAKALLLAQATGSR